MAGASPVDGDFAGTLPVPADEPPPTPWRSATIGALASLVVVLVALGLAHLAREARL